MMQIKTIKYLCPNNWWYKLRNFKTLCLKDQQHQLRQSEKDDLHFFENCEDDLNVVRNWRKPKIFENGRQPKKIENGRRSHSLKYCSWPKFFWNKDDLNILENGRRL